MASRCCLLQYILINHQIFILKYIENDLDIAASFFFILSYCVDGNLSRFFLRESEHAGGDTAERNTIAAVFHGELQAGKIAAFQKLTVLFGQPSADNRSDCVENILTR